MMSIKNLFSSYNTQQVQKAQTVESASALVESGDYIEAKRTQFDQFLPPINFTSASSFAKFGSAELYYENSFKRVYQTYPYDGTLAEKSEFHNSSSYLDKYIFEYLYPKTTGYIVLDGTSYIKTFGGPHTASGGMIDKTLNSTFDKSMTYSPNDRRGSGFEMNMASGSTVEFWLNRADSNTSADEYIFDLWNGETAAALNGRMSLFLGSGTKHLKLSLTSGSFGFSNQTILENAIDGNWNHFALTLQTSSAPAGVSVKLFRNNVPVYDQTLTGISDINPVTKGINATIGAKIRTEGDNKLNGSLDEFRFWKTKRTHEAISSTWFIPIGGGTNKHDSNKDLGVYYKFNEGITGNSATDSVVLDYSGRIHNGMWMGYAAGQRNTGSAIVSSSVAVMETHDPIIYSTHPEVSSSISLYKTSGSLADLDNNSLLYRYFPAWMQETDTENGKNLKYLSQIIASYFDTLWHQMDYANKIKDEIYISGSQTPYPFADKLLYSRGFVMPNLFGDASVLERFRQRDDDEIYEKEIYEVRNTLYHNLYNNLLYIYKSKGTEKSFRNFFRSLGINSELVRFNMYADDSTFVLRDNYMFKSFERKFLNMNFEGHFDATIFNTSSTDFGNTLSYVPAGTDFESFSLESEIILPRKNKSNEPGFVSYPHQSSSIMGYHSALADTDDITWGDGVEDHDLHVYVVKEKTEDQYDPSSSQRVKYVLSGSLIGEVESPFYSYQYENNKWNLALRLKSHVYPFTHVTSSDESVVARNSGSYTIEVYGVEAEANTKRNSFLISTTVPGTSTTRNHKYVQSNRRFYGGSHRTNFTGSVVDHTDIKLGYMRYWHSYMSDAAINQHAFDSETFGINEPFENDLIGKYNFDVPREKTLAFHWAFNMLTGSDASGEMIVLDQSSGSTDSSYGPNLSPVIQRYNRARVFGFNASSTNAIDTNFLYIARKRQPDNLHSSDLTRIISEDIENFFSDEDVSDNFYAFEKSMYGTISDEMLNMFSTALDFNNLIGQPNQRYNHEYHLMSFLKDKFFDDVENEIEIEKFTTFYKWIDDSISTAMSQLVPASARFSRKINNVIESHVLERNKYVHKVPLLTRFKSTEGSMRGVQELLYDWNTGHAPLNTGREDLNCRWQQERKEKSGDREVIRKVKNNESFQSEGLIRKTVAGSAYIGSIYANRKLSKPYNFEFVTRKSIHGGINYRRNKNLFLFKELISPGAEIVDDVPQNVITIGVGTGSGIVNRANCDDPLPGNQKRFHDYEVLAGRFDNNEYADKLKGDFATPATLVDETVHTGYNRLVKSFFRNDVVVTNIHTDTTYNTNDIPMQGPFTEAHVGGQQYRHVDLNRYDASKSYVVPRLTGGGAATGSISFNISNLDPGDSVTVKDSDLTSVTAQFASYFDLFENRWSNAQELAAILNNKLDVNATALNNSFVAITQSVIGTDGNRAITRSTTDFTIVGMENGTNASSAGNIVYNVDHPDIRPEGWIIVLKEHESISPQGPDGAMAFISPDYGNPLDVTKQTAHRFRDEHAKRPVNIRNIQYNSSSVKVGNYRKGYELVMLQKAEQKRWFRDAYDANLVLPATINTALPMTTNYMTLVSQAPFVSGNVFGVHENNRQPDTASIISHPFLPEKVAESLKFDMLERAFVGDGDNISIFTSGSSGRRYIIDSDQDDASGNNIDTTYNSSKIRIPTGSSDTQFFNNLRTAIIASSSLGVEFSEGARVQSKGIYWSRRNRTFLKRSASAQPAVYPTGSGFAQPVSYSFYLGISGACNVNRGIFQELRDNTLTDPGTRLGMDYFSGGDTLKVVLGFEEGGTDRENQYSLTNYCSTYVNDDGGLPNMTHFVITYDGGVVGNSVQLFINGVSSSWSSIFYNGTGGGGTPHRPDGDFIIGSQHKTSNNTLGGQSNVSSSIDEFVILNKVATAAEVLDLYNNGRKMDSDTFASLDYTSSVKSYFSFDNITEEIITDNQIIQDVKGFQNLTASVQNVGAGAAGLMNANTKVVATPASASFTVSGSSVGPQHNGHLVLDDNLSGSFKLIDTVMTDGALEHPQETREANDIVIEIPRTDLTSSTYEINSRFSAPGGPEVQSIGYLDAQTSTFSAHNTIPFRNLTVLGSGSGETGTLRVTDHLGERRGLKTLLALHMGQFGIDATYGTTVSHRYSVSGSYIKQQRNRSKRMEFFGSSIITGSVFDNGFLSSPIPRSEFQYSWINAAISGSNWEDGQRILGYAPPDGIVSSSAEGYVSAIVFPTASTILGS